MSSTTKTRSSWAALTVEPLNGRTILRVGWVSICREMRHRRRDETADLGPALTGGLVWIVPDRSLPRADGLGSAQSVAQHLAHAGRVGDALGLAHRRANQHPE